VEHKIDAIIETLRKVYPEWREPVVTELSNRERNPFKVLISTIISLRTKDDVTRQAAARLFDLATTPDEMVLLSPEEIEKVIYPAGFYKNKALTILIVCSDLLERFGGRVPDDIDDLLTLRGVGRKTANLVVTRGYNKQGICVDTHVHRISNRLGYVKTRTPDETEFVLRKKLPAQYWIEYNDLLVAFGQNICKPVSPYCSQCPVHNHCIRVGVTIHR